MKKRTWLERLVLYGSTLLVSELWHLTGFFLGWTKDGDLISALLNGAAVWLLFTLVAGVLKMATGRFESAIGVFFNFCLAGAILWLALQILDVVSIYNWWQYWLVGLIHFITGSVNAHE